MAIPVISKIVQRNGGKFKLMDSVNVSYDGTEAVSVKDKLDHLASRVMCFIFKEPSQGFQDVECIFPYDGTIKSISAIYKTESSEDLIVDIEKASAIERGSDTWTSILSNNLTLNDSIGKCEYILSDETVNQGDIFRVNIINNINVSSLTINIEIMI